MPGISAWRIRLRTLLALILAVGLVLGLVAEREHRARVRAALEQPMLDAAERGETDRIVAMLDRGADVDSITNGRYPWTPLMHAAFKGHRDTVLLLIRRGADLDHTDLDGFSAAALAAGEGHWAILQDLADHGADLDQPDGYGLSPRDYANGKKPPDLDTDPPDPTCTLPGDAALENRRSFRYPLV